MIKLAVACGAISLWLAAATAVAHPLDPALLDLRERGAGRIDVLFQAPPGVALEPVLPSDCTSVSRPQASQTPRHRVVRWQVECHGAGLNGATLGVEGLGARQTDALVRVGFQGGRVFEAVLRPGSPSVTIPPDSGLADVLRSYGELGLHHILGGPDHLLFVLALVLLVPDRRRLLWTITAFTAGHSVTLSLAVLGFVHVPPAPVEVLIALSIVVVAVELTHPRRRASLPVILALGFGLLHGLGFAGALAQVGLPAAEIPQALFAFNLGIEIGQILFVAGVLLVLALVRRLGFRWPGAGRLVPAYGIGSLAAFWVWERLAAFF